MKKILLLCLTMVIALGAYAAVTTTVTTTFITDINCENCVKKIEKNVSALGKGIKDVDINLRTKEVTVTYNPKKNSDQEIIASFKKIDVKASVQKAPAKVTTTQSKSSTTSKSSNSSSNRR